VTSSAGAQQSGAAQGKNAAATSAAKTTQSSQGQAFATGQMVNGQAAGMIFGSVTDSDGDLVPGALVTLTSSGVTGERAIVSDSGGRFQFSGVAAGAFKITVAAKGMAGGTIAGKLEPGAVYNAPPVVLRVASANSEITVTPQTEHQIAQQEVKVEETQRVLGIVPNYFVTYDKHPVPLDSKQKFSLGIRAALDPTHFLFAAGAAGVEQMAGTFPGFGPGPEGFGKRYGASLATTTTSELLRGSVYPSLFRQDPRYFYKGTGSTWSRVKYSLGTAVICKGDNGRWETNYSTIFAGLTAGAISNFYYAPSDRHGAALTFESGALSIAGVGFGHLMQEFVFRRFTSHAPPVRTP
jgi:hypothetical protein